MTPRDQRSGFRLSVLITIVVVSLGTGLLCGLVSCMTFAMYQFNAVVRPESSWPKVPHDTETTILRILICGPILAGCVVATILGFRYQMRCDRRGP